MTLDGYVDVAPGRLAAVVTSLQMTARPAPLPEPAQVDWTLTRHRTPDPGWYRALFRRVGEEWLWFSRLRMSDAELCAVIHDPAVEVYSVCVAGHDEGLLEVDFRVPGTCELAFFGLTDALRGRGAGRWLMNRALDAAWARPIERLWVHTCTLDHAAALDFYQRAGFVPVRRQIEVADDPRLLGVLPRTAAPHIPLL